MNIIRGDNDGDCEDDMMMMMMMMVGTVSNYDDDGSENITKKVYLQLFLELNSYGFIHVQIEKGKFVVECPHPL